MERLIQSQDLWICDFFWRLGPRRVDGHLKVVVNLKTSRMVVILKSISQSRKQVQKGKGPCPQPHNWLEKASMTGMKHEANVEGGRTRPPHLVAMVGTSLSLTLLLSLSFSHSGCLEDLGVLRRAVHHPI